MGAPSWINSKLGILTSSWLAEALRPLSDLRCRISQVSQAAEYFLKLTRDQDSQFETLRDLNCVGCAHMCGGGVGWRRVAAAHALVAVCGVRWSLQKRSLARSLARLLARAMHPLELDARWTPRSRAGTAGRPPHMMASNYRVFGADTVLESFQDLQETKWNRDTRFSVIPCRSLERRRPLKRCAVLHSGD